MNDTATESRIAPPSLIHTFTNEHDQHPPRSAPLERLDETPTVTNEPGFRRRLTKCPRRDREILRLSTGELQDDYCGANGCRYCAPRKSLLVARAIAYSEPNSFVTLTKVGSCWPEARDAMKTLKRSLKARHETALAWVVEEGHSGPDLHIHAMTHGEVPSRAQWASMSQQAGMGQQVDVRPLRSHGDRARTAKYVTKTMRSDPERHLDLNGRDCVHASRDYWRSQGEPTGGLRASIKATRGRHV